MFSNMNEEVGSSHCFVEKKFTEQKRGLEEGEKNEPGCLISSLTVEKIERKLIINGNSIKISEINEKIQNQNQLRLVIIVAKHAINFDDDIKALGISFIVISPLWFITKDSVSIDLSGLDGHSNSSGGRAGVYQAKSKCFKLKFLLNGGKGSDGHDDADGIKGNDGIDADKVDKFSQNIYVTEKKKNIFSSRKVLIYRRMGTLGENGGNGGNGRKGGKGGCAGEAILYSIKKPYNIKVEIKGKNGRAGCDGEGGRPGIGGKHGYNITCEYNPKNNIWNKKNVIERVNRKSVDGGKGECLEIIENFDVIEYVDAKEEFKEIVGKISFGNLELDNVDVFSKFQLSLVENFNEDIAAFSEYLNK
jgi:hypothetical protein